MSPLPNLPGELSVYRTFVVQLALHSVFASDRVAGRVEHVVTGRVKDFESLPALLAFLDEYCARSEHRDEQSNQ